MGNTRSDRSGNSLRPRKPLWICPKCGAPLVTRNMSHSCGAWSLDHHFKGRPKARELFDRYLSAALASGPVTVVPQKTRICFMTRVRFAGCTVRKDYLRATMWLTRRVHSKRFVRIESLAPKCYIHHFVIREASDLDKEVLSLLREARRVGDQEHLV